MIRPCYEKKNIQKTVKKQTNIIFLSCINLPLGKFDSPNSLVSGAVVLGLPLLAIFLPCIIQGVRHTRTLCVV